MKRILLAVSTFILAGAGVSRAADHGTGLMVPPLSELQRQFDEQTRAAGALLETELKRIDDYRRLFGPLPEDSIRRRLPSAKASEFDWTTLGVVSEVQDQGQCNSCYIFSPVAAFEASYHIRNGVAIGASEQAFLDVAKTGCDPGWVADPLTWLITRGTAKRSDYPYTAQKGTYRREVPPVYRGAIWGIVSNGTTEFVTPSQQNIKEALLRHGPLITVIYASKAFIDSKNKPEDWVFSESKRYDGTNHAVTLVGWSDKKMAWKIKNSWGKEWGNNGFAWVRYGTNNVGSLATWVEAPINLLEKLPQPADVRQAFEDELGKFHVRLERGTATFGNNQVTLKGIVSVGHTGARTKLTLNGELKLQKGDGAVSSPVKATGNKAVKADSAKRIAMEADLRTGKPAAPWISASGSGLTELQIGAIRFNYQRSSLELAARGDGNITFSLTNSPDMGCSSTIGGTGSVLGVTEATLTETDRCPGGVESTYTLRITPTTASGSGTLKAFGTTSQTTYTLRNQTIEGKGTWNAGTGSWRAVPNNPQFQWRVVGPSIQSTYTLPTLAYRATLASGRIEVQSSARKPDGTPWAAGQAGLPPLTIGTDGMVNLPLPQVPLPRAVSPTVYRAYCDATCGEIRNLGLNLGTAVPSGTGISGLGTLQFVNEWQSQCEIWAYNPRKNKTEGNGKCKATTTCPPGQQYFQANDQKWYCRVPAPQPPQLPNLPQSISVKVDILIR